MKRWSDEVVGTVGGSLTLTGTLTAADVVITDDLTVGDDVAITDDVTVTGDLNVDATFDADGPVNLDGADSIDMPDNSLLVTQWVSSQVTEASIVGGSTTEALTVSGLPTTIKPIAVYFLADEAAASNNGATTTLTVSLGVSGATSGYLAAGANIIGVTGRLPNAGGTLLGSYRAADTLLITLTTNGGGNTAHISNLALRVVVEYLPIDTE